MYNTSLLGLNYMDDDGNPVNGRLFNEDHMSSYNNAAWLLSYQIRSVLQTAKKID